MTQQLLIQNGALITPAGELRGDLRIVGERIHSIGLRFEPEPGEEVLDATGCVVLPGLVDPHTHIQLDTGLYKTPDDWAVGTRTAACGGVTTVIDFATQFPGQDVRQAVANRLAEAHDLAAIDYGLHVMLTELPEGDDELDDWMADLVELGTPSAKVYTTYRPNYYQDDDSLLRVLRAAGRRGVVVMVHAENDALVSAATARLVAAGKTSLAYHGAARPALAEVEAVQRMLLLAREANCPLYVVHNSTARSAELIHAARQAGQVAWSETCPQYLTLDERVYAGKHPEWGIMQPPLRHPAEPQRLWDLVISGAVNSIGTDHCDYTLLQKHGLEPLNNQAVQEVLARLPEEEREMVVLRAGLRDGWQREWSEVAHAMGTSRDAIRRLENDAVRRLQEANGALATLQAATAADGQPRLPFTQTPGGIPGLETMLPLLATDGVAAGRITWSRLAELTAANPARVFGLYPRKGALLPGSDADVVVFDPATETTIRAGELHNIAGYTPYEGRRVRGRVRFTLSRGQVVCKGGEFTGHRGWGHLVAGRREPRMGG
ncbi:MAG TPA: amidohydrolase family protein [Anaerolineae bacterium]|nr:amidohydrolase family protein [Anaerolineae bacterium]HNU05961.1 amidohydrolase family protein [Anaerolineae bacterium]